MKTTEIAAIVLVTALVVIGLVVVQGCKKEPEPAPSTAGEVVAAAEIMQKTCPVMGGTINKDLFVEYKGKKVYFCCSGCEKHFEAEPEKYLAKLPQFSK
jgi:YHS domain-containing protein